MSATDQHSASVAGDTAIVAEPSVVLAGILTITKEGPTAPVALDAALAAEPRCVAMTVAGEPVFGGNPITALVALEALVAEPVLGFIEDVLVVDEYDTAALITRASALGAEPGGLSVAVSGG